MMNSINFTDKDRQYKTVFFETFGCQMNVSDSQLLASELEKMGHHATMTAEDADILVVNSCVVRQQSEDKAFSKLSEFHELKKQQPDKIINFGDSAYR